MDARKKCAPLIRRKALHNLFAIRSLPGAATPVNERARIAWVVQDSECIAMLQLAPDDIASLGSGMNATRKQ